MAAIVFPSTLPSPSVSTVTPAERRLLSDVTGGPQQARGVQRDYLATQSVEWPVLTASEAAILDSWWKGTLTYGGAWFASTWAAPQGFVSIVRRFMSSLKWTHLPGGFWRVTADVQVRGRSLPPTVCFTESFTSSLGPYRAISGDQSIFSIVLTASGASLQIGSLATGAAAMERDIPYPQLMNIASVRFMIHAPTTDDGGDMAFVDGTNTEVLLFEPRTTHTTDAAQRARINVAGEWQVASPVALDSDTWYRLDMTFASGAGNTQAVITKEADASIVQTTVFAVSHALIVATRLRFLIDSSAPTAVVTFDDVHIC